MLESVLALLGLLEDASSSRSNMGPKSLLVLGPSLVCLLRYPEAGVTWDPTSLLVLGLVCLLG